MKRIVARGAGPVFLWGCVLTILWIVGWAIFDTDTTTTALGAWMAGSVLFWAGWIFWRERRAGRPAETAAHAYVDGSHATALLGIAITCALLSTIFGLWLALAAAGMALAAFGGLARERRAVRSALREVEERQR